MRGANVLTTDPRVADSDLVALEDVVARSDVLVITAPHPEYRALATATPVVDVWGLLDR